MLFPSLTFLYYFLPVTFIVCLILKGTSRNVFLLTASLFFYGWADPKFLILIILEILAGYLAGQFMEKADSRTRKWILAGCILLFAGLFGYFKYTDFLISVINSLFLTKIPFLKIVLPLGISFYTFQILSYVIDVFLNQCQVQKSLIDFALYVAMFPQLVAGPIVRYTDIESQLKTRSVTAEKIWAGCRRFTCGLAKKVLIANSMYAFSSKYFACQQPSVLYAWLNAIALCFYTYFDFSGYSDMAIGLGLMFGFELPENFNYPFTANTITNFWRRWHMSLTQWFKDYVYIPLGGSRCSSAKHIRNLLIVWLFTGIWHGAGWTFIFWGLGFFVILVFEKFVLKSKPLPYGLSWIYTFIIITVSFTLFHSETMKDFFYQTGVMFNLHSLPFVNSITLYAFASSLAVFVMAAAGSTPIVHSAYEKICTASWGQTVMDAACFLVLILCLAWITGGSFNPFLYFRF